MAKQKNIKTTPWEPFARTAARVVRVRADELFAHAEGVLDTEDIERVHDMRVASRRLRAVLEIFAACFPKAEYKSVLRDVKRLADALGERRDPDVHIAAMEEFAASQTAANRPGIERLQADLRERQARGNDLLAAELERMAERDLHGRLLALSEAAEAEVDGEDAAAEALAAADLSDDGASAAPTAAAAGSSPDAAGADAAGSSPDSGAADAAASSPDAAPDLVAAAQPDPES